MNKQKAQERALAVRDKWEQIVTDAFRLGYLTDDICMGCGKMDCGGCPAGTCTGWHPDLRLPNVPVRRRSTAFDSLANETSAAPRNTEEQLVRQTSALQAAVAWLELNGHDAENRKRYNGELHQNCYACRILDQCKAALLNAASPAERDAALHAARKLAGSEPCSATHGLHRCEKITDHDGLCECHCGMKWPNMKAED